MTQAFLCVQWCFLVWFGATLLTRLSWLKVARRMKTIFNFPSINLSHRSCRARRICTTARKTRSSTSTRRVAGWSWFTPVDGRKSETQASDMVVSVLKPQSCRRPPDRPWIAVLDCSNVHILKEFLSKGREGLPWVKIYMLAGYTSKAQPLDQVVKCAMARTVGEHFARCVLQQELGAPVQVEMGVKILWTIFVDATKQIEKEIHFSEDLELIMPAGSRAVLAAAHETQAREDLFHVVQDGDIVAAEDAADDETNEEDDADGHPGWGGRSGWGRRGRARRRSCWCRVQFLRRPSTTGGGFALSDHLVHCGRVTVVAQEAICGTWLCGSGFDFIRVTVRLSRNFTARIVLRTISNIFSAGCRSRTNSFFGADGTASRWRWSCLLRLIRRKHFFCKSKEHSSSSLLNCTERAVHTASVRAEEP